MVQSKSRFFSLTLKIQVKSGRTLRCGFTGKRSGALRVHLEGLGCSIENAENNKFVRYYAKNIGPVLCVQLSNSAATHPESLDNLVNLGDHVNDLLDCVKQAREICELVEPINWSGHSFGATVLLQAATQGLLPKNSHIEVISPYSRCLSYFVMDSKTQVLFNYLRSFQDTKGARIVFSHLAFRFLKLRPDPQLHHVLQTPLQMQAALEVILPMLGVDLCNEINHKIKRYHFHLITAEGDDITPSIVHLPIYEKVLSMGADIRMTVFEDYGHFLPYEVKDSELIDLMSPIENQEERFHTPSIKVLTKESDPETLSQVRRNIEEKSKKHLHKRFSLLMNTQNTMNQLRSFLWNSTN